MTITKYLPWQNRIANFVLVCTIFTLALLMFFSPGLESGKIQAQSDHLYRFSPWASVAKLDSTNRLLSDQTLGFIPFYKYTAEVLADGELPLWNPYSLGGVPFAANLTSAIYYPVNWLYYLFPDDHTFVWIGIVKLLIAALACFGFLRALGITTQASMFGAMLYMFSGFNVVWLFHPLSNVSVLLPLLFLMAEKIATTPRISMVGGLALVVALSVVGGHLETAFHSVFGASLYFLLRVVQNRKNIDISLSIRNYTFAVGLGLLLSSIQLVPFLEYLLNSSVLEQRSAIQTNPVSELSFSYLKNLVILLNPDYFGSPLTKDFDGPLTYNVINSAFTGRVALVFAMISLFLRTGITQKVIFLILAVFIVVIVYIPYFTQYIKLLPGFSMSNTARIQLLLAFSIIVLASFTMNWLLRRIQNRIVGNVVMIIVTGVALIELFDFGQRYNPVADENTVFPQTEAINALMKEDPQYRIASAVEAFPHETHLPYRIPSIRGYDAMEIKTFTELAGLLSTHEYSKYFIFATPYFDRLELPILDLFNIKYYFDSPYKVISNADKYRPYHRQLGYIENESVLPRAFLVRRYQVITEKTTRLALLQDVNFQPGEIVLLEKQPEISATGSQPCGSVRIVSYRPNEVHINTELDNECFLVLTDNYFPGWKATADGEELEIYRAYHTFRSVKLSPGVKHVQFLYRPVSFTVGFLMSLAAILFLLYVTFKHYFAIDRHRPAKSQVTSVP